MSSANFRLTEAQLVGNWFETLAYGMYLVSCWFCAKALVCIGPENRWRKTNEIRWFSVFVAVSLFVVGTFDVIIGLLHNVQAFVFYKGEGGAQAELTDISNWINVARSVTQVVQMIIGDFVLIYRCYIVYSRRWKYVLVSFVLYLGGIAMAIKLIQVEASLHHAKITLNSSEIQPWWLTFFGLTAVQNMLTTGLLIWRIWQVERNVESYRHTSSRATALSGRPLRKVIRVIAESGVAYTTLVLMTFISSFFTSNLLYPLGDTTLQAAGIAFNVIIARCTPSRDQQFTTFEPEKRGMGKRGGAPTALEFATATQLENGDAPASPNVSVTRSGEFMLKSISGPTEYADGHRKLDVYDSRD